MTDLPSVWLHELTWKDVEAYLEEEEDPIAIVPIGATEQHGPHLPTGVDSFEAMGIAEGIAKEAGVITTPPNWFGDSGHHMGFPGTIALSPQTTVSLLSDIYESLIYHGFENIITVNGHRIANLPAIDFASKQTKEQHPDVVFGAVDLLRIGVRIHNELREGDPEDGMHAGEFETSYIMWKHPDLVREDEIVKEVHGRWTRFTSSNYVGMDDSVPMANTRHDWGEDDLGHDGDPTLANPEKGEKLHEAIVANGVEFIENLRAMREAQRSGDDEDVSISY